MSDQTDPTRSQAEGLEPFFATFAGEAYRDGEILYFPDADKPATFRHAVPAIEIHAYFRSWLMDHWKEMVDYAIDSESGVVEDPQVIVERKCPKAEGPVFTAHGQHRLFNDDGSLDYECPGLKGHPATQIGRQEQVKMVAIPGKGVISAGAGVVLTGVEKTGRSPVVMSAASVSVEPEQPVIDDGFGDDEPRTSTHRNAQLLRDMGHDV